MRTKLSATLDNVSKLNTDMPPFISSGTCALFHFKLIMKLVVCMIVLSIDPDMIFGLPAVQLGVTRGVVTHKLLRGDDITSGPIVLNLNLPLGENFHRVAYVSIKFFACPLRPSTSCWSPPMV